MTVTIEAPTAAHLEFIAAHMRKADRDEVYAASRRDPLGALQFGVERSEHSWVALIDGVPSAVFGVASISVMTRTGAIWLLGTDNLKKEARQFLPASAGFRDQLLERYAVMRNFIDVRNTASARWLRWLGAHFEEGTIDVGGYAFRMFELRAKNV